MNELQLIHDESARTLRIVCILDETRITNSDRDQLLRMGVRIDPAGQWKWHQFSDWCRDPLSEDPVDPAGQGRLSIQTDHAFSFALDPEDRERIREYFEKYPVWADGALAKGGEATLQAVGQRLFEAAFGNPPARLIYQRFASDPANARLIVQAPSIEGAAVPWEWMRDPENRGAVALALHLNAFFRRSTPPSANPPRPFPQPAGGRTPMRVLLVICRPDGENNNEIPLLTIGRVLQRAAKRFERRIQLDVLRPPTFEALGDYLANKSPYHVVHFDGHGILKDGRGALLFEGAGGGRSEVSGEEFGALLFKNGVPAAVLNACRSAAAQPSDPRPSFGQQVLDAGVRGVVAMSQNVLVDAAERFVARLYERILQGDPLDIAFGQARRLLHNEPMRPTVRGYIELRDWAIPVLFQSGPVSLFCPDLDRTARPPPSRSTVEHYSLPLPADGLVDRDAKFSEIERILAGRDGSKIVLLTGEQGMGKTATAAEFARWWAATCGAGPGAKLLFIEGEDWSPKRVCDVVADAFSAKEQLQVLGTVYPALEPAARREAALKLIKSGVCVIVLDDVSGLKDNDGSDEERSRATNEARAFLNDVGATTGVALLLTAKTIPSWLDGINRRDLGPLAPLDAGTLIGRVKRRYNINESDHANKPSFTELLDLLQKSGRPGKIILALNKLTYRTPDDVLSEYIKDNPPPEQQLIPAPLRILGAALFVVCLISLTGAYGTGGIEWARMFNDLHRDPTKPWSPRIGVNCFGYYIELIRAMILICVGILWFPGQVFREAARRLMPFGLSRRSEMGPPTLGVVLCWSLFVALGIAFWWNVSYHHFWDGPRDLWENQGYRLYPFEGPKPPDWKVDHGPVPSGRTHCILFKFTPDHCL